MVAQVAVTTGKEMRLFDGGGRAEVMLLSHDGRRLYDAGGNAKIFYEHKLDATPPEPTHRTFRGRRIGWSTTP